MAEPHPDVLRHPARLVADVDVDRQGPVDRIADLLEAVDDDVDPAAPARRPASGCKRVSIVKVRDRSTPRSRSEIRPLCAWPGLTETSRGDSARQVEPTDRPAGWGDQPNASPVTNQPSKLSRLKSSNTISIAFARRRCSATQRLVRAVVASVRTGRGRFGNMALRRAERGDRLLERRAAARHRRADPLGTDR